MHDAPIQYPTIVCGIERGFICGLALHSWWFPNKDRAFYAFIDICQGFGESEQIAIPDGITSHCICCAQPNNSEICLSNSGGASWPGVESISDINETSILYHPPTTITLDGIEYSMPGLASVSSTEAESDSSHLDYVSKLPNHSSLDTHAPIFTTPTLMGSKAKHLLARATPSFQPVYSRHIGGSAIHDRDCCVPSALDKGYQWKGCWVEPEGLRC